jgi:serine/threonine protein phosphatase PrpC
MRELASILSRICNSEHRRRQNNVNAEYKIYTANVASYTEKIQKIVSAIKNIYGIEISLPGIDEIQQERPVFWETVDKRPTQSRPILQIIKELTRPIHERQLDTLKINKKIREYNTNIESRINEIQDLDISNISPADASFTEAVRQLYQIDHNSKVDPESFVPHVDIAHWISQLSTRDQFYTGYIHTWLNHLPKLNHTPHAQHLNLLRVLDRTITHAKKYYANSQVIVNQSKPQKSNIAWLPWICTLPDPQNLSPLQLPKPRRKYGHGLESHANNQYTIAYTHFPTTYALENGYANEDSLLFDIDAETNNFFIIVCDGVSKACLSHIASRSVAQMMHFAWKCLLKDIISFTDTHESVQQHFVEPALTTAAYKTAYSIKQELDNPPEHMQSSNILTILKELNTQGGSQSTFSCVFSYNHRIYCIWMGNSPIRVRNSRHTYLEFTDERFLSDKSRFSSTAPHGMRGNVEIEIIHDFPSDCTWQICIHSDAFDMYENKSETLYVQTPIARPTTNRPLNLNDQQLELCRNVDDTTIVELFYEHIKSDGVTSESLLS